MSTYLSVGNMKSQQADYLELAYNIYKDACDACVAEVSNRDLKTIRSRIFDEGISFLTITLPAFCADFERSLAEGAVDSTRFQGFRKRGAIPAFLQGMLSRIFDVETGRINDVEVHDSPDTYSDLVAAVRQICLSFKKVELPCTPERTRMALENFIAIERSFEMFTLPRVEYEVFDLVSSLLWDDVMRTIRVDSLLPRHGPGATAERVSGNQKFNWKYWHHRLEPYLPIIDGAYPLSCGELHRGSSELERVSVVFEDDEQPVRVTPVPKTLKGPRIIAIEPCCMQYAQQGIRRAIYSLIESHWLTAGRINFRDQTVNQSLAMSASYDGRLATIDLKDASDRVPLSLALLMFRGNPDLRDFIEACRSTRAEMPDGTIIGPLNKFASMGSALCFPIEAMYFYTICVIALLGEYNLPVSRESIYFCSRDVYVYGDDIIVPSNVATAVIDRLRMYNCRPNERKTFYSGNFRESCGVDAYLGSLVTPTYVGTALPSNRRQVREILSWVESANHFYKRGYIRTALQAFNRLERILGPMPSVPETSPALGRNFFWDVSSIKYRWNKRYQRLEIRCWVPAPVYRTDPLDGYAALQKCLLRMESNDSMPWQTRPIRTWDHFVDLIDREVALDPLHLERSAQHGAVAMKRRWVAAELAALRVT
jgi:hypothetical protein